MSERDALLVAAAASRDALSPGLSASTGSAPEGGGAGILGEVAGRCPRGGVRAARAAGGAQPRRPRRPSPLLAARVAELAQGPVHERDGRPRRPCRCSCSIPRRPCGARPPKERTGVRRFRRRHLAWSTTRRRVAGPRRKNPIPRTGQPRGGRRTRPPREGRAGGRGVRGARARARDRAAACPRCDRRTARLAPALWRGATRARRHPEEAPARAENAPRMPASTTTGISRGKIGDTGPRELLPRGGSRGEGARGCERARAPAKIVEPIEPRAARSADPRGADPRARTCVRPSRVSRLGARV